MLYRHLSLSLLWLLTSTITFANDTSTTAAAGQIVFAKNDQVEMRSESLKISLDKIEVDYTFFNKSPKDISLDIAFPLPSIHWRDGYASAHDPLYDVYLFLDEVAGLNPNSHLNTVRPGKDRLSLDFSRFALKADGKDLKYTLKYSAKAADGSDITQKLSDNGIPLSIMYVNGWVGDAALDSQPRLRQQLKAIGLLNEKNVGSWYNDASYTWSDTFPAKRAHRVSHAYGPEAGSQWLKVPVSAKTIADVKISNNWKLEDYCPSADVSKKILARRAVKEESEEDLAASPYPRAHEIGYVLTTGANWSGPIKDFVLEVTPKAKHLVAFCWEGKPVKPQANGKYVVKAKNFIPKQDLRILMLEPYESVFEK